MTAARRRRRYAVRVIGPRAPWAVVAGAVAFGGAIGYVALQLLLLLLIGRSAIG